MTEYETRQFWGVNHAYDYPQKKIEFSEMPSIKMPFISWIKAYNDAKAFREAVRNYDNPFQKCPTCHGSCFYKVIRSIHGKVIENLRMCENCLGLGVIPTKK